MRECLAIACSRFAHAQQSAIAIVPAIQGRPANPMPLDHADAVARQAERIFGNGDGLRAGYGIGQCEGYEVAAMDRTRRSMNDPCVDRWRHDQGDLRHRPPGEETDGQHDAISFEQLGRPRRLPKTACAERYGRPERQILEFAPEPVTGPPTEQEHLAPPLCRPSGHIPRAVRKGRHRPGRYARHAGWPRCVHSRAGSDHPGSLPARAPG